MAETRVEKDSLGRITVPKESYFGAFTARALKNFQISGIHSPKIFAKALGLIKLAALKANTDLDLINKKYVPSIEQACKEFLDGKFSNEFILDVFQAGAGTSYNMNVNEILANRANELLGKKKGACNPVHPNNHINMAQSTNDVIPAAIRVAALLILPQLLKELTALENSISKKANEYKTLIKVGRTHLQDAVPIKFSQEFNSYKEALEKSGKFILQQSEDLKILGLGGTSVGTGINTDPTYKNLVIKHLSKLTNIKFKSAKNLTEISNNANSFLNFSAALRSLAVNLLNFSANLKLMNTGPHGGLNEISLPVVQPGSSIMPGKVNPSIPECVEMICMQVIGNDKVIEIAAGHGQFELNTFCPIIMHNLIQSMEILTNGIKILHELAMEKLVVNKKIIRETFEKSLCTATALSPYLGYYKTAEIVQAANKKGISIKEELLSRKIFKQKEIDEILSPENTTKPSKLKKHLVKIR